MEFRDFVLLAIVAYLLWLWSHGKAIDKLKAELAELKGELEDMDSRLTDLNREPHTRLVFSSSWGQTERFPS